MAASLVCGIAACGGASETPYNVVFLCWDTVRADHLGPYGYTRRPTTPFLDELSARSLTFANAFSNAAWTKPSVPSFLTGTYPCQHGVYEGSAHLETGAATDVLPEAALTIAEVFSSNGYQTAAYVRNAQLRPGNGFEQGFDEYHDRAGDAAEIRESALGWIDGRSTGRPFFLYLHCLDAHWPYPVPDEYARIFAGEADIERFRGSDSRELRDAINDGEVPFEEDDREALLALYDGAIRYLDDQLALLMDGLEARGLAQNTIVCLVSDHGEEFGEHGRLGHGHGLWESLLRVPWILHVPAMEPARIEARVSLVDLFPTLISAAFLPVPGTSEGVNRLIDTNAVRPVMAEHKAPDRYLQSLSDGETKLLRDFSPTDAVPGRSSVPVRLGTRWEAELARDDEGDLYATQLKPRDEEPEEPAELKGIVERAQAEDLIVSGFRVLVGPTTKRQLAEGAQSIELVAGMTVKIRGAFGASGFEADKIKIYGPDSERSFELRGPVTALEEVGGVGRMQIGGQWVRIDAETRFKGAPKELPMSRSEVLQVTNLGAARAVEAGFALEIAHFDLETDEAEVGEPVRADRLHPLSAQLDELIERLSGRRTFVAGDRKVLTEDALQGLRDIGYVE